MTTVQAGGTDGLRGRVKLWAAAVRPFSFPCSVMPVLIAAAAVAPVSRWHRGAFAAGVVAVLAMHVAGNLLNDYFDYTGGVDTAGPEDEGRPGRFLVNGVMTPHQYLHGALVALGVAVLTAAYLTAHAGAPVLAFYVLGIVGLYAYTGPPFRLKARALGELVMVIWFGTGPVAAMAWVQVQRFPPALMVMSVPIGFLTAAILTANNLRDLEEDSAGGVRTLAHRVGPRTYRWLYMLFLMGAPVGISAVGVAAGMPALALTMLGLLTVIGPIRAVMGGQRLPDIDARTARLPIAVGLIATAVLMWHGGL